MTSSGQEMRKGSSVRMNLNMGTGANVRPSQVIEPDQRSSIQGSDQPEGRRFDGQPGPSGIKLTVKAHIQRGEMIAGDKEANFRFRPYEHTIAQNFGHSAGC
jgi:hypothetical protein